MVRHETNNSSSTGMPGYWGLIDCDCGFPAIHSGTAPISTVFYCRRHRPRQQSANAQPCIARSLSAAILVHGVSLHPPNGGTCHDSSGCKYLSH
jgi:hypothetical protein